MYPLSCKYFSTVLINGLTEKFIISYISVSIRGIFDSILIDILELELNSQIIGIIVSL